MWAAAGTIGHKNGGSVIVSWLFHKFIPTDSYYLYYPCIRERKRENESEIELSPSCCTMSIIQCRNTVFNLKTTTVCPGSSDPFYIVSYYVKWATTSWTYSTLRIVRQPVKIWRSPLGPESEWETFIQPPSISPSDDVTNFNQNLIGLDTACQNNCPVDSTLKVGY